MTAPRPTSVVEAMASAHAALRDDLRKLDESLATPAQSRADTELQLQHLWEDVGRHFRLEEQNGYLEGVLKRQPQREREVQALLQEHRDLIESLRGLIQHAADPSYADRVRAWLKCMQQHESRENLLVEDAYDTDISAED